MNLTAGFPALLANRFAWLCAMGLAALTLICVDCLAAPADKRSARFEAQVGDKASVLIRHSKAPLDAGNDLTMVALYGTEITSKSANSRCE